MIVIDAGVSIDWFLPNPNELVKVALDRVAEEGALVPALWRWEVQDVLRLLAQRGRLTQSAEYVRAELRQLPISIDDGISSLFGDEAAVAARYKLTVYDAAYVELAIRLQVPLATNDGALQAAVKAANLEPLLK